jgi:CHASE3 domain sensor protein
MKSLYKRLNARQLIILGISVPALLLILVGGLQWQSVRDYREALEWITHTRVVMLNLESFLTCVNNAETGQRGYLLTHKESYLEPYNDALTCNPNELQTLRRLTSDNPVQQKNLDRLEPLVNAKFAELGQTVALEKNLDHNGALKIVLNDFGKNTMDQIRAILRDMRDVETGLLQQREEAYQQTSRKNAKLSGLIIAIGLGFIITIYFLLRRLERMQEMIKICAWSKLIEYGGEWLSIEDYLTRRFHAQITHGMSDSEAKKFLTLINEEKQKEAA